SYNPSQIYTRSLDQPTNQTQSAALNRTSQEGRGGSVFRLVDPSRLFGGQAARERRASGCCFEGRGGLVFRPVDPSRLFGGQAAREACVEG
ncbi:MAG: hypothetical protein LW845_13860, partial [Flammeovirgaceae bacterium]|nr:hypothetical protein [Flammeovirgaceae bacterium]